MNVCLTIAKGLQKYGVTQKFYIISVDFSPRLLRISETANLATLLESQGKVFKDPFILGLHRKKRFSSTSLKP